jgi:hypothetical protein
VAALHGSLNMPAYFRRALPSPMRGRIGAAACDAEENRQVQADTFFPLAKITGVIRHLPLYPCRILTRNHGPLRPNLDGNIV